MRHLFLLTLCAHAISCGTITRTVVRYRDSPAIPSAKTTEPILPTPATLDITGAQDSLRVCNTPTRILLPVRNSKLSKAVIYVIREWNMWAKGDIFTPITYREARKLSPHEYIQVRYLSKFEEALADQDPIVHHVWKVDTLNNCILGGNIQVSWSAKGKEMVYLRNTLLHTLGLALGLNYIYTDKNVMSYRFTTRIYEDLLPLHPDTVAMLHTLYKR